MNIDSIVEWLNWPFLGRIWIQANLKWVVSVSGAVVANCLLLFLAFLTGSPVLFALVVPFSAVLAFLVLGTGTQNGVFVKPVCRLDAKGDAICLTFDDGPHPEHTPRILDVLHRHETPATFFVVGEFVRAHPEIVRRAVAEGHEIGNHSCSHKKMIRMGPRRFAEELEKTDEAICKAIGLCSRLFRPPHGLRNPLAEWVLRRSGYCLVHWDVSPKDWKRVRPEVVLARLKRFVRPGSIVLLHDTANAAAALEEFIPFARQRGFRFCLVGDALSDAVANRP